MAPVTVRGLGAFAQRLEQRGPDPAYLLLGEDRRSLEDAVALLEARVPSDLAPLVEVRLRGGEHAVAEVVDACSTLPLGGTWRLVVVREPERLKGDAAGLASYLADPNPTTCLVLVPVSFDRRLRTSKALEAAALTVLFEPPGPHDVEAWVRGFLATRGITITPDALELLADLVQAETLLLSNEVEKLAIHAGDKKVVERADVESLLGRSRTIEVFQLTNAVEDGNAQAAVTALRQLLAQGAAIPMLVAMLDWCLGRLLGTEPVNASPARQAALRRRKLALQGRAESVYARLREADRLVRTTGGSAEAALERAVLEMAR